MSNPCAVNGCDFELSDGGSPMAEMLLAYEDMHPTENPPFPVHGHFLCPGCFAAWKLTDDGKDFLVARFGENIPELYYETS